MPRQPGLKSTVLRDTSVVHYNPDKVSYQAISGADRAGTLNELGGMGPVTREQAIGRVAASGGREKPVAVTERDQAGNEMKGVVGTDQTAPAQVAALEANKAAPENTVHIEPVNKVLQDRSVQTPLSIVGETQAQGAREAEVQRGMAEAQAREEPPKKGGHRTKGEIAALKANNIAAQKILDKYPQTQQDWRAVDPTKPGGLGARTIALERLQNMVNEANKPKAEGGVNIAGEFNPVDNPAHSRGAAVLALREANDFLKRANKASSEDWTGHMIREGQLRRGQMDEVMATRKREAEEALARQGIGPRAGEVSLDQDQASQEDIAKYR